jgi:CzcA family heavy metal efflux pump
MNLATAVSNQRRAILALVAVLCAVGVWAAFTLPTSLFPQTDFPRIVVSIDAGDMPAPQMLASITQPIEEAMNGIPGVTNIRSDTSRGSAEINVFFDWGVDVVLSQQFVESRLSQLRSELPADVKIETNRLTFAVFPIIGYSFVSDTRDPASLRDVVTLGVVPRLSRLPGVAHATALGGKVREYHVLVDPGKLASEGLGITDVADAINASNVVLSSGRVETNHQLDLVLVSGQVAKPEELEESVVGTVNGKSVILSQVATVEPGVMPEYVIVTADGKPSVLVNVNRQPDANTVAVSDAVKAELAAIRKDLPPDIKIAPFYDQSLIVRGSVASVRDAILIGLLLSVAILFLFLRDWRMTVIATAVIPITVLVTFLAMKLAGLGFDLMTLGGIAAAIGLIIDDAIVVVENIYTHVSRGQSRREAVASAISEITVPIIGSTLTPVVVFLPLSLLTGITGVFFRALALTMAVALLTSLVLALTFTPVLAESFIRVKPRPERADGDDGDAEDGGAGGHSEEGGRFLRSVAGVYERALRFALAQRLVVFIAAAAVVVGGVLLYRFIGTDFLPQFDEGGFVLDYIAPEGASLAETDRTLRRVEKILEDTPEVESFSRRTGAQLGLDITEPNTGDFLVKLKSARSRSTEEVKSEIRDRVAEEMPEDMLEIELPGILTDLINDLISSTEPIEIKVFSNDTPALLAKADEITETIDKVAGVTDTNNGVVVSGPALTFHVDPLRAAALGVTATQVADATKAAVEGEVATSVLERGRLVGVRVILPPESRASVDGIKSLPIKSGSGAIVRLDQVADVEFEEGQTELHRDNLRQAVVVTAGTENTDLGTAIAGIKSAIAEKIQLPPGMTIEYGGIYQEQQSSFRALAVTLALAVLLVFVVLLIEFRSFAAPTAIVAGALLALTGVLAGLLLTGMTLNIVSFMGAIMVVGIVAKNGILMLDTVEEHLAAGDPLDEALVLSGRRRLRPVLMTSFAAILGMLPLALAIGEGSQLLQPLAIAVIGGLAVALLLSLLLTPTIYFSLVRRTSPPPPFDPGPEA